MTDKKKPSIALWIAAGGGILVLAVAAFLIFSKPAAHKPGDDANELGPDTVRLSPSSPGSPAQLASATSSDPSASPATAPAADEPLVKPQSVKPAGPAAEMHFEDAALKFDAYFPGPESDPVIADRVKDTQGYLDRVKRDANRAKPKSGKWKFAVKWYETARAEGVASLLGVASEDRGGAHPAPRFDTLIARTGDARPIKFDDMMLPDHSPSAALAIAICEGLKAEKKKRIGEATIFSAPIVCVGPDSNAKVDDVLKVLAASTTPGKFGGAYIYYPPYAVGAFSEGSYDFVVPQSVFALDLRPDYKPMFAGDPKKPEIN